MVLTTTGVEVDRGSIPLGSHCKSVRAEGGNDMKFCPYCSDSRMHYDVSARVYFCMDCEYIELVVPRSVPVRRSIKTTRLPSRRTLGRVAI